MNLSHGDYIAYMERKRKERFTGGSTSRKGVNTMPADKQILWPLKFENQDYKSKVLGHDQSTKT